MPVTKTRTRRYMAFCDVADCEWITGPHGLRIIVSQRLTTHLQSAHGLEPVDITKETHRMKVQKDTELPEQDEGNKLSEYAGQLVVFRAGWTENTRKTQYGERDVIDVVLYVYDPQEKAWQCPGEVSVFFATVRKRLLAEGPDDDIGGVLVQGTERNSREWDLTPPTAAQIKILDKFDPSF